MADKKSDEPKVVRMWTAAGAQVTVAEENKGALEAAGFSASKPK